MKRQFAKKVSCKYAPSCNLANNGALWRASSAQEPHREREID
jgi:hypothetical protein